MLRHGSTSFLRALVRTLLPSPESLAACLTGGLLFTILHVVFNSLKHGTLAPGVMDGYFSDYYLRFIGEPLDNLLHNVTFNNIGVMLVWGLLGLVLIEFLSMTARAVAAWHTSGQSISFSVAQSTLRTQERRSFLLQSIWKLGVVTAAVCSLVALAPLLHYALGADEHVVTASPDASDIGPLILAWLIWSLLFHVAVACTRLYVGRTRLGTDNETL